MGGWEHQYTEESVALNREAWKVAERIYPQFVGMDPRVVLQTCSVMAGQTIIQLAEDNGATDAEAKKEAETFCAAFGAAFVRFWDKWSKAKSARSGR